MSLAITKKVVNSNFAIPLNVALDIQTLTQNVSSASVDAVLTNSTDLGFTLTTAFGIDHTTPGGQALKNSRTLAVLLNNSAAMETLAASGTAMTAILNSGKAINAIVNSTAIMDFIAASPQALGALWGAKSAVEAMLASTVARTALRAKTVTLTSTSMSLDVLIDTGRAIIVDVWNESTAATGTIHFTGGLGANPAPEGATKLLGIFGEDITYHLLTVENGTFRTTSSGSSSLTTRHISYLKADTIYF